jgi:ribosomal protein S18 acetylase RimI-like enzyme
VAEIFVANVSDPIRESPHSRTAESPSLTSQDQKVRVVRRLRSTAVGQGIRIMSEVGEPNPGLVPGAQRRTGLAADAPTATDRPRPDRSDIRRMTDSDVEAVARTLAQAFYDDPHFGWISRDDIKRMRRLEAGFRTFVSRVWLPQNESYTHERRIGAGLWMPPGTWKMSMLAQLRLLPMVVRDVRGDMPRLLKALTFMENKHPHQPLHWYLASVGVTPAWQGRGYGAALLRPVLERCDSEHLPAYLEASTPRNRALYERHGFEVIEECRYAKDAPPLWRMWRNPSAS